MRRNNNFINMVNTPYRFIAHGPEGDATIDAGAKTYTEAELKTAVETAQASVKKERDGFVTQLEAIKKNTVSVEEKKKLQAQIDELQTANLSKEEKARLDAERLQTTFEEKEKGYQQDVTRWQGMYADYRTENEILKAANEQKAFNPSQLVTILRPDTKLVESKETVDGREVVKYTPIVRFQDKDKHGNPVLLDLPVADVIKRMKELPEQFGNLFKSDTNGGTGLMNGGGASGGAGEFRTGMSTEEYAAFRKKQGFGGNIR